MADLDEALRTLGLDHGADASVARRRFRTLLKGAHPDRGGDPAAVRQLEVVIGRAAVVVANLVGMSVLDRRQQPLAKANRALHVVAVDGLLPAPLPVLAAPIAQNAFLAIHESDITGTAASIGIARVQCNQPGLLPQGRDVYGLLSLRADNQW